DDVAQMGAEARQFFDRRGSESEGVAFEFFQHANALQSAASMQKISILGARGALEIACKIAVSWLAWPPLLRYIRIKWHNIGRFFHGRPIRPDRPEDATPAARQRAPFQR